MLLENPSMPRTTRKTKKTITLLICPPPKLTDPKILLLKYNSVNLNFNIQLVNQPQIRLSPSVHSYDVIRFPNNSRKHTLRLLLGTILQTSSSISVVSIKSPRVCLTDMVLHQVWDQKWLTGWSKCFRRIKWQRRPFSAVYISWMPFLKIVPKDLKSKICT